MAIRALLIEDNPGDARLQSGRVELYLSEVDLRDVVTRALRPLEPLIQARDQALELCLPSEPVLVAVDAQRFGRACVICGKRSQRRPRGRTHQSRVGANRRRGRSVGFGRWSRHSVPRPGPGLRSLAGCGLGLPIARGLVELHRGMLTLHSEPGRGSTFRIRLLLM